MTLISRILGFVRDAVIASLFGADAITDAFFVAFRIPNFFRRLFSEGSFSQALVPTLTRFRERAAHEAVQLFLGRTAGGIAITLGIVTGLGVAGAPLLVRCFAPGFTGDAELFSLSTDLVRITFPYLLLITLTAFAGAVLNTYRQFAIPAMTPALLNLTMIAAAFWIAPLFSSGIYALAWGVLLAGVFQLAFQLPFLAGLRLLPRLKWGLNDPDVRKVLRVLGPAVISASVTQINVLLNTVLASFLVSGSVSWLYYSDRLVEFPVGLFGVALGTVMLPHLAKSHQQSDAEGFSQSLDWALRGLIVLVVPAMLGLIVLAEPLLYSLFQYDHFSHQDVAMTRHSLVSYASGLLGFVAARLLLSGFAARHDFRTPLRFAAYAIGVNVVLSLVLAHWLAPSGRGHAGLALAAALAGLLNAGMLLLRLYRTAVYRPCHGWALFLARVVVAAAAMTVLLLYLAPEVPAWQVWAAAERLAHLGLLIAAGLATYGLILVASGMRIRHLKLGQLS